MIVVEVELAARETPAWRGISELANSTVVLSSAHGRMTA
jgi:hypothetical protein